MKYQSNDRVGFTVGECILLGIIIEVREDTYVIEEEFVEEVYTNVTEEQILVKEPEVKLIEIQKVRDRIVGTFHVGGKTYCKIISHLMEKDFTEEIPQNPQSCVQAWAKGRIITEDMLGVMKILDDPEKIKDINPIYIEWLETIMKKEEEELVTEKFEMDFEHLREVCEFAKLLPRDLFIFAIESGIDAIKLHKLTREELMQSVIAVEQGIMED